MNASDPSSVTRPAGWTREHESRWATAIWPRLKKVEGGYVDHAKDRGGATKYGISLRFLAIEGKIDLDQDGLADFDLNRDGRIDALDVRLLTPTICEALYLRLFMIETGFWSLPRPFDAALFDLGVNVGTGTAVKILQRALNRFGPPMLKVDAGLGPKTIRTLEIVSGEGRQVLSAVRAEAEAYYRAIVANDPGQRVFLNGWLARAGELGRVA